MSETLENLIEEALSDLVEAEALQVEVRNHLFEFVTASVWRGNLQGVRSGRRCRRCKQWAMGDHPGETATAICPEADLRYVSEWRPTQGGSS